MHLIYIYIYIYFKNLQLSISLPYQKSKMDTKFETIIDKFENILFEECVKITNILQSKYYKISHIGFDHMDLKKNGTIDEIIFNFEDSDIELSKSLEKQIIDDLKSCPLMNMFDDISVCVNYERDDFFSVDFEIISKRNYGVNGVLIDITDKLNKHFSFSVDEDEDE